MNSDEPPTQPPSAGVPAGPAGGAGAEPGGGAAECERAVGALGLYFDRTLSPQERRNLDAHFSGCPTCRRTAEEYAEVIRLAGSLPPPPLPRGVEQRLRELISNATRVLHQELDCSLDETVVGPIS